MRFITGRVRALVSNRRGTPRATTRLPLVVSLANAQARRTLPLKGHTRDISESGLGMIVPSERIGGQSLVGEGRQLQITLELEKRRIQVNAVAVRHAPLGNGEGGRESGHLIGARITEIVEGEHALLSKHLKKLRFPVRDYAP